MTNTPENFEDSMPLGADDLVEEFQPEHVESPMEKKLEAELAQTKDALLRLAAEMENLRKRSAQEVTSARQFALQGFAKDILPVADNLVRALEAPQGNEEALRKGVAMVAQTLEGIFARHGITPVESKAGEQPNPEMHQVMQLVASDFPAGSIVQTIQAGFLLNGRLLRPALVTAAQ